jgi:hypothetical protein
VYIDRDTGLPVYRIVWDQSGRRKKVILGIVRSLEFDAGQFVPTLAGQIVLHSQDGRRLALVYDSFTACTGYTQGRTLEDFDPSSFMRFPALPEERKKPTEGPSEKFKTE